MEEDSAVHLGGVRVAAKMGQAWVCTSDRALGVPSALWGCSDARLRGQGARRPGDDWPGLCTCPRHWGANEARFQRAAEVNLRAAHWRLRK